MLESIFVTFMNTSLWCDVYVLQTERKTVISI